MSTPDPRPNVELTGVHLASSALIQAGFEIARPERDTGADLIVWRSDRREGRPLRARPVQVKGFAGRSLKFDRRYRGWPDMLHLHVLNATTSPEIVGWLYPMWWKYLRDTGMATGGTAKSWNDPTAPLARQHWYAGTLTDEQEARLRPHVIDAPDHLRRLADWADLLSEPAPCPACAEPRVPEFAGPRPPDGTVEAGVAVVGSDVVDPLDDAPGSACLNVNCGRFYDA